MPSISAIARDWCVSRPYVSRCVHQRGCPTSSLEEARKWREENAQRRAPTNQKSITRAIEEQGDYDPLEANIPIPLTTAKDIAFRGYDAILDLVLSMPQNI